MAQALQKGDRACFVPKPKQRYLLSSIVLNGEAAPQGRLFFVFFSCLNRMVTSSVFGCSKNDQRYLAELSEANKDVMEHVQVLDTFFADYVHKKHSN